MEKLYNKLINYSKSDYYPFHMPGHKRQMGEMVNPYLIDITEITDFDDLHHSEGLIKEIEEKAAKLYGAEESRILINGSTCGILSAISACVKSGEKIAIARNCHKSVYHGILLNRLKSFYLYPEYIEEYGINGGISSNQVEELLLREPDISAVFITSPTYEGVVSDIGAIAKVVHKYKIPLIVDEAHGAHFYFSEKFPKGALNYGADIVINSLHKTLPCFTQTALLHVQGNFVKREKLRKYLSIYQTSSPSYILMAGIQQCLDFMEKEGAKYLDKLWQNLEEIYVLNKKFTKFTIVNQQIKAYSSVYDFDLSKIVIVCKDSAVTGEQLKEILCEKYHLELEMSAGNYCLAMTTLADTLEGIQRLKEALIEQDQENVSVAQNKLVSVPYTCPKTSAICTLAEAEEKPWEKIEAKASQGRVSAEMVYIYPPGIPILCPGEEISEEVLELMESYCHRGLLFRGMEDETGKHIRVVKKR